MGKRGRKGCGERNTGKVHEVVVMASLASIRCLLFFGGPTAVAGFIVASVVDAIERQPPRRSVAHVGQEIFKGHPAIANGNPARAVVFVTDVVRAIASAFHTFP